MKHRPLVRCATSFQPSPIHNLQLDMPGPQAVPGHVRGGGGHPQAAYRDCLMRGRLSKHGTGYNNRIQKCLLKFNFNVILRLFFYFCRIILYFLTFHLIFKNLILILYILSLFNNTIFKYILIAFNFLKCNSSIDLSSIKI